MSQFVSLAEAATYLGVSKATLRNWDKAGKLTAIRHPTNDYRLYALSDLRELKSQLMLFEPEQRTGPEPLTAREVRRLVSRLHNILRDQDSGSNLLERFDELSKLLFVALMASRDEPAALALRSPITNAAAYASQLRREYRRLVERTELEVPEPFRELRCSDRAILECGQALAAVDFAGSAIDVKGLAYEEVIKRTFDKTDNQQFFTPAPIVQFMIDMLGSVHGDICDPAAGTGGFLVEIARRDAGYSSLTALEIDQRLAWTAGINMLLHGGSGVKAMYLPGGGSLGPSAKALFNQFDLIVTNPPFGSDYADEASLSEYVLGQGRLSRRRGILFIERCHEMLKPGGRLAIIIDEGVLNLSHARDVRAFIFSKFRIDAIVSLPEGAFMPYASVNAAILFLTKGEHDPLHPVFFGRADKIGRRANGDEDILYSSDGSSRLNSDLPDLLSQWVARSSSTSSELAYWTLVGLDGRDNPDLRLDFRFHHPSREQSAARLEAAKWPLRSIGELCEEITDSIIPAKELPDTVLLYTGLAHIESNSGRAVQEPTPTNSLKSAVKRYEPGDIVFAKMRPNLRKVALMRFSEGGYVSPECMVLRPIADREGDPIYEPVALAALLRSDLVFGQITHLIAGIGRPRLNGGDLKRSRVPVPPKEVQRETTRRFEGSLSNAEALREQADKMLAEAERREKLSVEQLAASLAGGTD
jgi:type I restriction enzyme M protein